MTHIHGSLDAWIIGPPASFTYPIILLTNVSTTLTQSHNANSSITVTMTFTVLSKVTITTIISEYHHSRSYHSRGRGHSRIQHRQGECITYCHLHLRGCYNHVNPCGDDCGVLMTPGCRKMYNQVRLFCIRSKWVQKTLISCGGDTVFFCVYCMWLKNQIGKIVLRNRKYYFRETSCIHYCYFFRDIHNDYLCCIFRLWYEHVIYIQVYFDFDFFNLIRKLNELTLI